MALVALLDDRRRASSMRVSVAYPYPDAAKDEERWA
jgi:hypothetical protein